MRKTEGQKNFRHRADRGPHEAQRKEKRTSGKKGEVASSVGGQEVAKGGSGSDHWPGHTSFPVKTKLLGGDAKTVHRKRIIEKQTKGREK